MRCSFLASISTNTVVQGEQWNELVRMGTRFHLSCPYFNSFAHVNPEVGVQDPFRGDLPPLHIPCAARLKTSTPQTHLREHQSARCALAIPVAQMRPQKTSAPSLSSAASRRAVPNFG
jgi:hypothetical protein